MTKEELLEMSGNLVSSVIYPNKNKEGHQQRWKDKIKELLTIKPEQLLALKGAEIDYPKSETETGLIPEGWKLLKNLTIEYNSDKATLKKYIDKYRSTNPEWFKRYRHPSKGAYREYLSPELCDTINKEFPGHPPFGWLTLTALAKEVKVATNTVRNLIEKYRENNPSWFQGYRHEKALRREYLHPELVSIVKDNFKEIAFDKKGWITAHSLSQSRRVNISDTTIRLIIKKYRAQHPEWFKMLRNKKGNEREHYSPELVEKLINEYSIPEGWMIIADISKILGIISYKTIHKRLNKYRSTNPEWFRIYKDSGERQHECYAPKLVEIIKKD
jgi:predicted oxidoreductase (fatty acid repression mutant protein)